MTFLSNKYGGARVCFRIKLTANPSISTVKIGPTRSSTFTDKDKVVFLLVYFYNLVCILLNAISKEMIICKKNHSLPLLPLPLFFK